MKVWKLEAVEEGNEFWDEWYDKVFCVVVLAESEADARLIAHENGGDESNCGNEAWLDANLSSCVEVNANSGRGVICQDFRAA